MTITEFLLARIAEDEAVLERRGAFPHSTHGTDEVGAYNPRCPDCLGLPGKARVLAECKAKRTIIELHKGEQWTIPQGHRDLAYWHSSISDSVEVRRGDSYVRTITNSEYLKEVGAVKQPPSLELLALAAVYADHADYDPAWAL